VMRLHSLPTGAASPSDNSRASLRVGINCLDVNPSFVGGVTTYVLGFLEGFASAGNGCRFRTFVTEGNQHLFEQFRNHDNFEIVVIGDRFFSLRGSICRGASFLQHNGSGELRRLPTGDRP
jgi:hypothetical protein